MSEATNTNPDAGGHWGPYGGRYVPETLMAPLEEVGAVTVSVGVAACPSNAINERELFAASDTALYRAKREGRNLVVLAGGEPADKAFVTNSISTVGD